MKSANQKFVILNMNKEETSSTDLYNLAHSFGIKLKNICFKDQLPKHLSNGNYIINMANHDELGTHWIALIVKNDSNESFYFDSFGIVPPLDIEERICNNFYHISNKQIQNLDEGYCGQYCLDFLIYMDRYGKTVDSYENFLKLF